ncbi:hypothetical protein OSB04_019172 [Centaurea solstitialis]|uniref:Uncharacterized protein n=1 Tax=Centaurea solstitialis TaxID=347529 RepID=A0AA38SPT5_9ASTR|nr:hypothetical protein OSB04_019172 [Centaurea solstitialis]
MFKKHIEQPVKPQWGSLPVKAWCWGKTHPSSNPGVSNQGPLSVNPRGACFSSRLISQSITKTAGDGGSGGGRTTESDMAFAGSSYTKQKSGESASSSVFDKLTDELLIETLIRLPLKPANICKCVSKRFRSLISSSYFVRCYVNHHQFDNSFALYYQSKPTFHNMIRPSLMGIDLAFGFPIFESPGFSLSFLASFSGQEKQETLQYLASNNGLVLCCAALRRPIVYFVCNPLTKQWIALPTPPSNVKTVYIGFICNPQYSCDDEVGNKTSFKVVRIDVVNCESPRQLSGTLKLEIFCSVSGRWTEEYYMSSSTSDHELFYGWNYRCPSAVVCDGLLHWDTLSNCGIFTYDPYNSECRTIELPHEIRKPVWAFKHCLGESSGRLRYANFSWDDTNYRVWELKDYGNGGEWLLLHKVHLDEMQSTVQTINKDCMGMLSPHPLNQDVLFFWCRSSCRIVEYDMGSKLLRLPCFLRDAKIMSLLSPMFFPFVLPCWPVALPLIQENGLIFINLVYGIIPRRTDAETRCVDRDRRALLQFKQGLVDDYTLLRSWRNGQDCCHWRGVGCNNHTGEVIRLDLSATWSEELEQILGLSGEIDSSLLSLRSLRYLDLSGNSFTQIPDFIGSLTKLQHLKLAQIEFGSPEVPDRLGNLSNLQTLDLASSSVVIKNTRWLTRLSSLKYLNLSYIDLSESIGLLNNAIRLPSIVELHLVNCLLPNATANPITNLSNGFMILDLNSNYLPSSTIYPWLFNFSGSLTDVNLSDNELLGTIPEAFGTFEKLRNLDLTSNALEGGIPVSFGNLSDLRSLLLGGNNLNQDFPGFLDNLSGPAEKSLEVLDLYGNQLSGSLPDFTTFTALKELYLGVNRLNGSFPDKFEQISKLSILDLADNRITGKLPDLSALASLKELYFERNLLNGTLAEKLVPLSELKSLGVSSNFFRGTISETHVANLSRLTYLDLSYNLLAIEIGSDWSPSFQLEIISLSSCKLGNSSFPEWLRTQKNFSVLDISNAGIDDSVPSWFWESLIPGLRYLNLSSNQIHGGVPDLRFANGGKPLIDMSSNNFSGNLPLFPVDTLTLMLNDNMFSGPISSVCNLTILNRLDLSNNKLSGELPDCWKSFDRLVILNLENNGFIGRVPDSMGSLELVDLLSVRGNRLTGELPSSLRNCVSLRLLDLGENELSGKIPEWIGESLSMLLVLSLPFNRFNETVPRSLCQLEKIQILDLSVNDISGRIPECLYNISGMARPENHSPDTSIEFNAIGLERTRLTSRARYVFKALLQWKGRQSEYQKTLGLVTSLDLSSNRLTGEIPREITSLAGLVALNLSRNTLTGPVPNDIGRLRRLDFLDLSRNDLFGGIPTSLSLLSNLGVLDLSFNNLSGRIPKGTQLQSFDVSSFAGNPALCGVPLLEECSGDEPHGGGNDDFAERESDDDDEVTRNGFYVSIVVGFAFGFWGVCGSLVVKSSWRYAFFGFLSAVKDRVSVTLETSFARLRNRTVYNIR